MRENLLPAVKLEIQIYVLNTCGSLSIACQLLEEDQSHHELWLAELILPLTQFALLYTCLYRKTVLTFPTPNS